MSLKRQILWLTFLVIGHTGFSGVKATNQYAPGRDMTEARITIKPLGCSVLDAMAGDIGLIGYEQNKLLTTIAEDDKMKRKPQCRKYQREGEELELSLSCLEGCDSIVNPSETLRLSVECPVCRWSDRVEYSWKLKVADGYSDRDVDGYGKTDHAGWPFSDYNITVGGLEPGLHYTIEVTGWSPHKSAKSTLSRTFTVNTPTKNFHCDVELQKVQVDKDFNSLGLVDLKSMARALQRMTSSLTTPLHEAVDPNMDDTRDVIEDLFTSLVNVIDVIIGQPQKDAENKQTVSVLLETLDSLLDAALSITPSGVVYSLKTETAEAKVAKMDAVEVASMTLTSAFGGFTIPNDPPQNIDSGRVFVKFLAFAKSPYFWNKPTELGDSPVVSLVLTDQFGKKVSFDGIHTVRVDNNDKQSALGTATDAELSLGFNNTRLGQFNLTPGVTDSLVAVTVESDNPRAEYNIYMQAGQISNAKDDDTVWKISGPYPKTVTHEIQESGTFYYMITKPGEADGRDEFLDVKVSARRLICRYWNEEHEDWRSDGCRPVLSEDQHSYTCHCDHLTAFTAAEFTVPVNRIDFSTVFDKNILDNAVVLVVIISFFVLYVLLFICLRRKDKTDLMKWMVIPLVDNKEDDDYLYKLTVYTGIRPFSGTNCEVYFDIVGEKGKSGVRRLSDVKGSFTLSRASVRNFSLTVPKGLGTLLYVHIWMKPRGGIFDPWYLERLHVVDIQAKESFNFVCYDWFAVDRSDTRVERVLPVSGDVQLSSFDHLISNNTRVKFTDEYLWGSLISRPTHSYFTRIERLSCCITYLYMAMLANAMFYKLSPNAEDTTKQFVLGPLVFTAGTIYSSIVSCLVTLPATVVVVEIFRKSRPFAARHCDTKRQERKKHYQELGKKQKKAHPLPWWCKIIGWFLVFASMFLSSFFVVLYSLQWGPDISHQWLTSELTSFFLSACVIDPLKAVGLAILLTLIFVLIKKPFVPEADKNAEITQAEKSGVDTFMRVGKGGPYISPPSEGEVQAAHNRQMKRNNLKDFFREFLFYIMFLLVASEIAGTYRSGTIFYSNKAIMDALGGYDILDCHDLSCYWEWLNGTVIPAVNPEYNYNGKKMRNRNPRLSTQVSFMLGPVTLRQLRVRSGECLVPDPMDDITRVCVPPYSSDVEQHAPYNGSWEVEMQAFDDDELQSITKSPWVHTRYYEDNVTYAPSFFSSTGNSYSGYGYVAVLGMDGAEARNVIEELFKSNWIDRNTRAVFLEFTIYNANINVYSLVTFLTEFFGTGTVTATYRVDSIRLLDLFNFNFDTFISILCHVIFLIMVIYLACWWAWKACKEGRKAVRGVFKCWDLLLFILSLCTIGLFFARLVTCNVVKAEFQTNRASYGSVRFLILIDDIFNHFIALVPFFCMVGFLRLLTLYRRTRMFFFVFRIASNTFISFSIMLGIIFLAFAQLFYLYFGSTASAFSNFFASIGALTSVLLGSFKGRSGSVFAGCPPAAQGFMVTYIFIESWVLIMLLVSVLNIACNKARLSMPHQHKEDAIDVIVDWIGGTRLYEFFTSKKDDDDKTKGMKSVGNDAEGYKDPLRDLDIRLTVIENMTNKMNMY